MTKPHPARVLVALLLLAAGCGDRPGADKGGMSPAAVAPRSVGITLAGSELAGLALERVVLVRHTADIVELRADLVNRGTGALAVGTVQEALASPAGAGAAALVTEDGGKRFYPLVRVDAGQVGKPQEVPRLDPGARIPMVIRFGPVAADLARLTPVVPGFAASPPLHIAENR